MSAIQKLEARIVRQVTLLETDPTRQRGFTRTLALALLRADMRKLAQMRRPS